MVVDFRLGRLKNTAPVHKSKFRKRGEFILVRGAFWSAFGSPLGSLWDPLGDLGFTLGYLGTPVDPFLVTLGPLGHHFGGHVDFGCAENVVRVVNFRLERLKNTAPVHKSKFRKRVKFILVLGCFLACFWEPFWEPLGHLGGLWGHFGPPWGHLGPPWPAMGCSGTLLGLYFARLGCLFNILGSKV